VASFFLFFLKFPKAFFVAAVTETEVNKTLVHFKVVLVRFSRGFNSLDMVSIILMGSEKSG
jgi:hypothetical protein